jgi:hypothetical protein
MNDPESLIQPHEYLKYIISTFHIPTYVPLSWGECNRLLLRSD